MSSFVKSHRGPYFNTVFQNLDDIEERSYVPVISYVIGTAGKHRDRCRRNKRDIAASFVSYRNLHYLRLLGTDGSKEQNFCLYAVSDLSCRLLPEESRFKLRFIF